jgi:hypothetical protein
MSLQLAGNTSPAGLSSTLAPSAPAWKFIEKTYTGTGAQEWIYLPDRNGQVGVTVSFPSAGAASIEVTNSPPDIIEAGNAVATTSLASVTAATSVILSGVVAFRLNIGSGTATKISAAC